MSVLNGAGLLIALYLAATKLAGEVPVCGPLRGCETVNASPYSEFFGIPVAVLGAAFSTVVVGASVVWWRARDGRGLRAAYGLGLIAIVFLAYLVYLELFVIHAICVWCVGYTVATVAGFAVAAAALRRA